MDPKTFIPLTKVPIPVQTNGYDCGAHVLAVADVLVRNLDNFDPDHLKELLADVTPDHVASFRHQLGTLAKELSTNYATNKK